MTIEIKVGGETFERFETASLSRSIDASSGSFSFTSSDVTPRDYPIKEGDLVNIIVDGSRKATGRIFEIQAAGSDDDHTITVSGRDTTADLIDSSLPDSVKAISGPISLQKLSETVIGALGLSISVTDKSGVSSVLFEDDLQAGGSGDKCMDFIMSFARKRQIYITPDGLGGLVLFRPSADQAASPLLHLENNQLNNVRSWSVKRSQQGRFNKYICRSQDNVGASDDADYGDEGTSRTGAAFDDEIRSSRLLEISAEETMTASECLERAKEESNIRRARGLEYECTVAGHSQSGGTVWDIGQRVNVQDFYADVYGDFLIRSVTYSLDSRSGSTTKIVCAQPDAYSVRAKVPKIISRKATMGGGFGR